VFASAGTDEKNIEWRHWGSNGVSEASL